MALALRLLGSRSAAGGDAITTTTRLCLDVLKSARVRREEYVGPWLPDPVTDTAALAPDTQTEMAEDLSVALPLALDRLSSLERVAFLCSSSTTRSPRSPARWIATRRRAGSWRAGSES